MSISLKYLPGPSINWFPPLMYLGVALTTEEANHFAGEMILIVERWWEWQDHRWSRGESHHGEIGSSEDTKVNLALLGECAPGAKTLGDKLREVIFERYCGQDFPRSRESRGALTQGLSNDANQMEILKCDSH